MGHDPPTFPLPARPQRRAAYGLVVLSLALALSTATFYSHRFTLSPHVTNSASPVTSLEHRFSLGEGDRLYLVPSTPVVAVVRASPRDTKAAGTAQLLLGSVIHVQECAEVSRKIEEWTAVGDDVWSEEFLEVIIASGSSVDLSSCREQLPSTRFFVAPGSGISAVPEGPYAVELRNGAFHLRGVYRLMEDTHLAFVSGVIPSSSGFKLTVGSERNFHTSHVPVPSRLGSTTLPLSGLRFGLKDIFDVEGLRTGCGSRAYASLYPERNATAPAVARLLELGAVLVGKTKTSQFANGEAATADWVDQFAPLNPRGDGYQDPSSSSSGSAVAVSAYDFLDFTVGSDTGGSIRGPASVNGAYAMRPSQDAISLDKVMPLSPSMDTAGFFTRDPAMLAQVGKAWLGSSSQSFTAFPQKLVLPVSTNLTSSATQQVGAFVESLASFLGGGTEIIHTSMQQLWNTTAALNETGVGLDEYMGETYGRIIAFGQRSTFGEDFIQAHRHANDDEDPFISPSPYNRWAYGLEQGREAYDEELKRQQYFADWFEDVLKPDPESCSDALLLYPGSLGVPHYRNRYGPAPKLGKSPHFELGRISSFAGTPEVVFPIGQVSYDSIITGKPSLLPVAVHIVARKGCDGVLLDLARSLAEAGMLRTVKTGKRAF